MQVFGMPRPRGKTSADLRVEIDSVRNEVQAVLDAAKAESRDLRDDEAAACDRAIDDIKRLRGELSAVEADEARRLAVAEAKVALNPTTPAGSVRAGILGTPRMTSAPRHVVHKTRAFKNTPEGHHAAYACGVWLKAALARSANRVDEEAEGYCRSLGWDVRATATEGTATAGGYLVPTPMEQVIIDVRALAGVSRQTAKVIPMSAETLTVPKKLSGTTVYYPGEAGAITASDQTWGQVQLTAKKRAILSKFSAELRDDALISIADDLASQMGTDFAVKEDAEYIKGDSTSTYGGETGLLALLGSAGVYAPSNGTGKSVWSGLTLTEFTDTMAKLPSQYQAHETSWICSSQFYWGVMAKLLAAAGGNTMMVLEAGTAAVPTFLGRRVYLTDQMPTATAVSTVSALYGSFTDAAIIGDRGGIVLAQSEHLGFAEDTIALRATTRYDINVHDSGDASSAGAYVGLSTAAS